MASTGKGAARRAATRVVAAPSIELCLGFANTRCWRGSDTPTETLADADALLRWLTRAGLADAAAVRSLRASAHAGEPPDWHAETLRWRETIYGLFAARAQGQAATSDARRLAALVAQAPPRQALALDAARTGWRVADGAPPLANLLAPVLWSAADLALSAAEVRLRVCDNPQCRWLFLDRSKAGTRRWCDMGACGNRAKARRHLQRRRAREAMA